MYHYPKDGTISSTEKAPNFSDEINCMWLSATKEALVSIDRNKV